MRPLRVLDLSLNLPGPYTTFLLAADGAEVFKVEPPRGDPARHMPAFFAKVNAGKRSIRLDLRKPEDREVLQRLLPTIDVLVEGFRPGVMERLGYGPEVVHTVNPRIVYCRISAYGQTGPRLQEPAHDLNLQALTGFCHLERSRDVPRATQLPLADLSTSLTAYGAIQRALAGPRERVTLDIGLADTLLSWTDLWDSLDPGELAEPKGVPPWGRRLARRPLNALRARLKRTKLYAMPGYGLFATSDGWIAVGVVDEQPFWERLCEVLGLPRAASWGMAKRTVLGPVLRVQLARRLRSATTATWLARLTAVDLPVTPVHSPIDALNDPQLGRRRTPTGVLSPQPGARPLSPAPELDADGDTIRRSLPTL